ncbi:hypothetical protein [Eshraghiella crossota]|uniref:hypothetical protein n=1 Tax=Eshraghiella crossota TaxID=45851 RepID=UPI0040265A54
MSREQERAKRKLEKNPIVECNRIYNNELEIKNDMTKERMCWIRHDVVYEVFFVVNF